ncbi:Aste57867_15978 [Aphanomyces stellatus]|uniref:Aste57867_15978 protein n=1 Tax=Aphanomyces stellatus TaxID=120398 RepID=A0A485L7J1_9STRA|nr:hypothetical protein As57867_015922 [Aphanomyces stellatus]VFT92763.1 Aste57867_15978 [Aphanomyces stellatus]
MVFDWNLERNSDLVRRAVTEASAPFINAPFRRLVAAFPPLAATSPQDALNTQARLTVLELLRDRHCAQRPSEAYDWSLIGVYHSHAEARDAVAPSATYSNTTTNCTICRTRGHHKMTTRYYVCRCRAECPKFVKILECLAATASSGNFVYVTGQYGECTAPPRGFMSKVIQQQAEVLFELGYTPSRARQILKDKIADKDMPSLAKFQNRYRYFRHHKMLEHSNTVVMMGLLVTALYNEDVAENKMFSFGYSVVDERPSVGCGGVSGPFKVGEGTQKVTWQIEN